MSFEEVEAKFKTVWEQIEGGVSKISEGEAAWLKRKGIRFEQKSVKKQKTTEEVPEEVKQYSRKARIAQSSALPSVADEPASLVRDVITVLAGGIDVPTGSGSIPTASPPATIISTSSEVGPTASPIVTRRKGKEVMVES
nr:hypothetical protein [Tanacetum cinerariifolium]